MAATNGIIELASGRRLSWYAAANGAVGDYVPIDSNQIAGSSSKTEFANKIPDTITGVIANCATGTLQLVLDGDRKPVLIDLSMHQPGNSGRPALNIELRPQETLSFVIAGVLPA